MVFGNRSMSPQQAGRMVSQFRVIWLPGFRQSSICASGFTEAQTRVEVGRLQGHGDFVCQEHHMNPKP